MQRDFLVRRLGLALALASALLLSTRAGAAPTFVLKTVYCNARQRPCGTLEQVIAREGLVVPDIALTGRARGRVGSALALAAWLPTSEEV